MHSATKYLSGHSDIVAGVLVTRNPELAEQIRFLQNATGATLDPFPAFLALRGIKTLALRMERHSANALAVAQIWKAIRSSSASSIPASRATPSMSWRRGK